MSDVPETPDGAVEATPAQSAGQATQDQSQAMPDGWTGEFDPHRAKATIERLREYEKQVQRLQNDPDAFQEFAQQHGYEFVDDEPTPEPEWDTQDYEDPNAQRLQQVEQTLSKFEQEREETLIAQHVVELTEDKGFDQDTIRYLFEVAKEPGYSPQRTEKIVNQYVKAIEAAEDRGREKYLESKRAPAPPATGQPGEPAPDLSTHEARADRIAAALEAADRE